MWRKLFGNTLNLYRTFALVGGVCMPLFRYGFPEEAYDPLWLRGIVALLFGAAFLVSLAGEKTKKATPSIVAIVLFAVSAWILFLLNANSYDPHYLLSYLVVVFCSFLLMPNRLLIALYLGFNVVAVGAISFFIEDPELSPAFVFANCLAVFFLVAIVTRGRISKMEDAFKQAEETNFIQNAAIGASRDGILLVDLEGRFIRANETFFEIWGFTDEWAQKTDPEIVKEAALSRVVDAERYDQMMDMPAREGAETSVQEYDMVDGRTLEISFLVVRMGSKPVGRMWFFRDISLQKKAEKELRSSERRLRMRNDRLAELAGHPSLLDGNLDKAFEVVTKTAGELLEADTCSIWFFDLKGQKMTCKKHFRVSDGAYESGQEVHFESNMAYFDQVLQNRMFSVENTETHGSTSDFLMGKYTGSAGAVCHAQIRAGEDIIGLLAIEQQDTREWAIEDQTFISSMADLLAISVEVNRRKRIREELETSFAVLKATFELSETGILVVDHEQNVIDYNDLYLKIWNMEESFLKRETYETKLHHLLDQVKDARNIEEGARMLSQRPGMEYAGIIEFKDGRIVERYSKGLKVGGEIIGRVWFYLDITERKRKENELISRNFELDSFVYRASHDLKAPLNSIMGLISIIMGEKELDAVLSYVAMMDKSVKKLEDFIKQLTQFSQDTRLQVVRKPIDLEELVEEIWEDLKYMENAQRVELVSEIEQEGLFYSDPVRLLIVFNNIISNAIKYQDLGKPQGRLKVTIQADAEGANCRFEDNGLGIDPEHLKKVFDLFFRASVQATGSGLGLYITHNAVEKLGGKIEVDSEKGRGTIFTLHLPNRLHEGSRETAIPEKS